MKQKLWKSQTFWSPLTVSTWKWNKLFTTSFQCERFRQNKLNQSFDFPFNATTDILSCFREVTKSYLFVQETTDLMVWFMCFQILCFTASGTIRYHNNHPMTRLCFMVLISCESPYFQNPLIQVKLMLWTSIFTWTMYVKKTTI